MSGLGAQLEPKLIVHFRKLVVWFRKGGGASEQGKIWDSRIRCVDASKTKREATGCGCTLSVWRKAAKERTAID